MALKVVPRSIPRSLPAVIVGVLWGNDVIVSEGSIQSEPWALAAARVKRRTRQHASRPASPSSRRNSAILRSTVASARGMLVADNCCVGAISSPEAGYFRARPSFCLRCKAEQTSASGSPEEESDVEANPPRISIRTTSGLGSRRRRTASNALSTAWPPERRGRRGCDRRSGHPPDDACPLVSDRRPTQPSTRILNEIANARSVLLNPTKKREYDLKLAAAASPPRATAPTASTILFEEPGEAGVRVRRKPAVMDARATEVAERRRAPKSPEIGIAEDDIAEAPPYRDRWRFSRRSERSACSPWRASRRLLVRTTSHSAAPTHRRAPSR